MSKTIVLKNAFSYDDSNSIKLTELFFLSLLFLRMEGQKINPEGTVSSNYKGIDWTQFRAKLLSDFYNRSPIDMQCNQSEGSRFPGKLKFFYLKNFNI